MVRLSSLRALLLAVSLVGSVASTGCVASTDEAAEDDESELRGRYVYDRFPTRPAIDTAMKRFQRDPADARARRAVTLDQFFNKAVEGATKNDHRVEFLKQGRGTEPPIAVLRTRFVDPVENPRAITNRFKDVHIFKLADGLGVRENPFPEAVRVPGEHSSLIRMWTDFRTLREGPPPEMRKADLAVENAKLCVWSYITGNWDGVNNAGNAGYAKFRDASGREFWRGVLVDGGATFERTDMLWKPWKININGLDPVTKKNIPDSLLNTLRQLARTTDADLRSLLDLKRGDPTSEGIESRLPQIRERAQEVLEHYGYTWK